MANAHIRERPAMESLGILTGAGGCDYVAAATVNAHTYMAITALDTDTTTVSATSVDTDIWDTLSTVEIPSGVTIYGRWTTVAVASGDACIVYRG